MIQCCANKPKFLLSKRWVVGDWNLVLGAYHPLNYHSFWYINQHSYHSALLLRCDILYIATMQCIWTMGPGVKEVPLLYTSCICQKLSALYGLGSPGSLVLNWSHSDNSPSSFASSHISNWVVLTVAWKQANPFCRERQADSLHYCQQKRQKYRQSNCFAHL